MKCYRYLVFLIEFKTEVAYFIAIHLALQILRLRYKSKNPIENDVSEILGYNL